MRGRFIRGLAAGALIGAAAEILMMSNVDRRTRKKMMRFGRRISGFTTDLWDGIMNFKR